MNSKNLQAIIRREVRKLIVEVADFQDEPGTIGHSPLEQDSSNVNSKQQLRKLFSLIPSSPFQGDITALSNVQLSNESRMALKNWIKFANFALKKYGSPQNWPDQINKISGELSDKFEFQVGVKNPNGSNWTV